MSLIQFAVAPPSTEPLSFGGSKLFQIVTPLIAFIILQELPGFRNLIPNLIRMVNGNADIGRWEGYIKTIIGFISWKIGCDFGFLIIDTGSAPWSIAFTWAGLIPYGIGMYVLYYLIGQKMIIQGQLNPFKEVYVPPRVNGRPSRWKQFLSKFFHESLNSTSANVPIRQVTLKPFLDYGAILVTWPLYNVALLYSQSGEINFDPMIHFTFLAILVFYIVNVFAFILGFNLGEFIYFRAHYLIESLKLSTRQAAQVVKINALWSRFDVNKDGSISADELRMVIRALGQDPTNAELSRLLGQADLDRSGSIEIDEFKAILSSGQENELTRLLNREQSLNPFKRLATLIGVQWQVIKNNTGYIRFHGFLKRYGLNNRWLLSVGLGLVAVILLEPTIASTLFDWSNQIQHSWFHHYGQLDPTHLAQVIDADATMDLPNPEDLSTTFPQQLAALYQEDSEILIGYQPSP